jgi:hypothetical protein
MLLMVVYFVPILFFMKDLYPWMNQALMQSERVLTIKAHYLNAPFFLVRQCIYFAGWILSAIFLFRGSKWVWTSAPALLFFVLSVTFSSFDWMMSLEPHWHSSIYGAMVLVGFGLATLCYGVIRSLGSRHSRMSLSGIHGSPITTFGDDAYSIKAMHDTGNLMLAFVLLWAYMGFSQFLIIWNANLSDEVTWYIHRTGGGWQYVIFAVLLFQFFIPLVYLFFISNKQNPKRLVRVAWLILIFHAVDLVWLLYPSFYPNGLHLDLYPLIALVLIGLPWSFQFNHQFERIRHDSTIL